MPSCILSIVSCRRQAPQAKPRQKRAEEELHAIENESQGQKSDIDQHGTPLLPPADNLRANDCVR